MSSNPIVAGYHRGKWALLLRGLVGIALGVFILLRPLSSVAALALVIAMWAVVDGIVDIVHAFELREVLPHWGWLLFSGIVSVLFGVAAFYYYPVLSLSFAIVWVSWWLILGGGLGISLAVQERKAEVPWGWTMAIGIFTVACGVLALLYPGSTLAALIGILGGFGIVSGIAFLVAAAKMQSFEQDVRQAIRTPSHA